MPVRVLVPDSDNLQYVAFWVARGAGYFDAEGVSVELLIPDAPAQAIARMIAGEAPVAVLPPPVYLELVSERFPVQLVANLLQNDPIDLVVRRSVFDQRHMSASAPLRDRLVSLKGLRVGVAPGPPARLRALFASVGLDADHDVQIVIRRGQDQNAAFAGDQCDALYAHTPFLEKAIDDQDAVMLVNQSAGEVPTLAMRQIHALVVRDDFLSTQHAAVEGMVRAIARAEALVHTDLPATEDAVMRAIPSMDRRHLHTLLGIYQPAVPPLPRVSVEGLAPALALFPANRTAPSLEGVPLADFVASDLAATRAPQAVTTSPAPSAAPSHHAIRPGLAVVLALLVAVTLAGSVALLRRRAAR
jgi:NitT/TauT family transport system substrate-binding protein